MSVLIKGMKMPKGCLGCPCINAKYNECMILQRRTTDVMTRMTDCPLIELPDHGDLVERDALEKELIELSDDEWNKKTGTSWSRAFEEAADVVYNAPVIIPAERREDD